VVVMPFPSLATSSQCQFADQGGAGGAQIRIAAPLLCQ
jgi:hypothetical protein